MNTKYQHTILTRSPKGVLGGVCEGLSHRYDVPVGIIRLAWVASVFVFGTGGLLYLALWWVVPRSDSLPIEPMVWQRSDLAHASVFSTPTASIIEATSDWL